MLDRTCLGHSSSSIPSLLRVRTWEVVLSVVFKANVANWYH